MQFPLKVVHYPKTGIFGQILLFSENPIIGRYLETFRYLWGNEFLSDDRNENSENWNQRRWLVGVVTPILAFFLHFLALSVNSGLLG